MSLAVKNLTKSFKSRTVVKSVDLSISPGEIVGLLGPNGAGKTTTFYMIVGLIKADSGHILLNSENVSNQPIHKRAQKGIGYLPQERSIFRKMSVAENIMSILELRNELTKPQRQEELNKLLQEFHLDYVRESIATSLSGGECRRVEIARAPAMDPKYILLDEPFAGVDPISISEINRYEKNKFLW